ncbi:MAG TPA: OsmC family protein [Longimicrobium sp.]
MKILLLTEDRLRVQGGAGPLSVEADSAEMTYSPGHMLASSLAVCTYSILQSWATNADIPAADLAVEVGFEYVEKPHRIGKMEVALDWPSLPTERREAARRAAGLCPIHRTLHAPPEVTTLVPGAAQAAGAGA